MRRRRQPERPDPDEQQVRQEEMQAQSAAASAAARDSSQSLAELQSTDFLDRLRDPEVDSASFPNLSDQLGPELSGIQMLANEDEEDYRRHLWLNENRAQQMLSERNAGRLCRGPFARLAQQRNHRPGQGEHGDLAPDEVRKLIEAETTVKTARQSLGKGARGLRGITEATAVSRVEHPDRDGSNDSRSGMLSKIFG